MRFAPRVTAAVMIVLGMFLIVVACFLLIQRYDFIAETGGFNGATFVGVAANNVALEVMMLTVGVTMIVGGSKLYQRRIAGDVG